MSAPHPEHRKPGKHRKPAKHRKPPKRAIAVVGATAVATVAVAGGVASAAPDGQAHPATPARPAHSEERSGVAPANVSSQLAAVRARLATAEPHTLLAQEQRLEAARLAAARRAAARRAAALAAQQAAQRAAQQAAQAPAAPAPSSATPSGSPQQIAMAMLGSFGWSSSQFGCLQSLWNRESGWNPSATNPTSGAYGIPQALPGDKMASAGADWQTNPATQIRWGLGYIKQVYGSPCAAWSHEQAVGSY